MVEVMEIRGQSEVEFLTLALLDDDELMLRVRNMDDMEAFEILLQRYASVARRVFIGYFRCETDIEDMVQNLFLRIFRARKRYHTRDRFRSWFYRIALNLAHDEYRKRRRHINRLQHFWRSLHRDFDTGTRYSAAEEVLQHREDVALIEHCIEKLPKRQRQVLILRYIEELSLAEIGESLGLSVGSVKSSLHHAQQKLKAMTLLWAGRRRDS